MTTYMEEGFTPEAVLNYLSLLGWSPKDDRQKMAIGEVISLFDLPQILRHNARFDMDKLLSLNGQYLGELDMDSHVAMAKETLEKKGVSLGGHDAQYIRAALESTYGKFKQMSEILDYAGFYFTERDSIVWDPQACEKHLVPSNHPLILNLQKALSALETRCA